MAKAKTKTKKTKKAKSGGFFAKIFDSFMALVILAIVGGAIWYWFFYGDNPKKTEDSIKGLYEETKEKIIEKPKKAEVKIEKGFDEKADDEEMEKIDSDILGEDDEMMDQFEDELVSNYSQTNENEPITKPDGFSKSIDSYAKKYNGLKVRNGADPDHDRATDNSHLICSIWKHAASENNMKFKGYMTSDEILRNLHKIRLDDLKNGDIIVLKNNMIGMIIKYVSKYDFQVVYASEEKNSVLISNMAALKTYWLKPENLKGYYRINKDILN